MIVEISPAVYIALCGLVQDALQQPSDATPLLLRVKQELEGAAKDGMLSSDLLEQPEHIESLRRAGIAA